jgi:site-specific DNA-methyltransferase (adenine-specific)
MEKLLLGNCLSLMSDLPDASIDAIITDLPFGVTNCKWDIVIPFDKLWAQYKRITKSNSPILLFSCQPFTSLVITSNIKMFRYCWYWEKEAGTGFLNSKKQPLRSVEEVCVFYKKPCMYNPQMVPAKAYSCPLPSSKSDINNKIKSIEAGDHTVINYGAQRFPKNLLRFKRDKNNLIPTQKPLALVEYFIKTYTNEGMIVLDSCMGAGTTGIAAIKNGRDFIGMEINENHFNLTKTRFLQLNPQPVEHREPELPNH